MLGKNGRKVKNKKERREQADPSLKSGLSGKLLSGFRNTPQRL